MTKIKPKQQPIPDPLRKKLDVIRQINNADGSVSITYGVVKGKKNKTSEQVLTIRYDNAQDIKDAPTVFTTAMDKHKAIWIRDVDNAQIQISDSKGNKERQFKIFNSENIVFNGSKHSDDAIFHDCNSVRAFGNEGNDHFLFSSSNDISVSGGSLYKKDKGLNMISFEGGHSFLDQGGVRIETEGLQSVDKDGKPIPAGSENDPFAPWFKQKETIVYTYNKEPKPPTKSEEQPSFSWTIKQPEKAAPNSQSVTIGLNYLKLAKE